MPFVTSGMIGSGLVWGSTKDMSYDRNGTLIEAVGSPPFQLGANTLNPAISAGSGFLLETMGTWLLCLVVMMTAVHPHNLSRGHAGPQLAPLAIGFAVFIAHVVLIPFTGCGINPARTFGPAAINSIAGNSSAVWASSAWIYYVGPMTGACLAAGFYLLMKNAVPESVKANDINLLDKMEPVTSNDFNSEVKKSSEMALEV